MARRWAVPDLIHGCAVGCGVRAELVAGAYLLARDPRKPVLVLAATGLCGFAAVVALEAIRMVAHSSVLSQVEIYLATVPGVAWFAVLIELGRPCDSWRAAPARCCWWAASRR
ncbi:hypothetical protein I553_4080 [Mycobacterium xenopi 4042]|uniref:Uncharacterized protein n=1 Tax=Mycobacterium xenopi 4042 TaxID=1299334 RepID=X8AD24_MYCXE|nr:hypothetical protein I553_4080 [Mycobacterium xenopi 4042]